MAFRRHGLPTTRAAVKAFSCKVTATLSGRIVLPIAGALSSEVCGTDAISAVAVTVSATPLKTEEKAVVGVMVKAVTTSNYLRAANYAV